MTEQTKTEHSDSSAIAESRLLDGEASQALTAAWHALKVEWDSSDAHRRFLFLADTLGELPQAAKLYRSASHELGKREVSEAQLGQLVNLALSKLVPEPRDLAQSKKKIEWVGLGLSAVLIAYGLFAMLRFLRE